MWPAFPTSEYYDPLRLPLDHPSHFPGSPVIGRASLPAAPQAVGAETALPGSQDDHPHVQRPIRRRVPQRPLLEQERFPWPSPCMNRLGTLSSPPKAGRLTTLTQASLTLQTARSLRPASHPASRPRTGASLPGTQASPRTGLTPAGHRELIAPTSCGPPFPHGARAVPAHAWKAALRAQVRRSLLGASTSDELLGAAEIRTPAFRRSARARGIVRPWRRPRCRRVGFGACFHAIASAQFSSRSRSLKP